MKNLFPGESPDVIRDNLEGLADRIEQKKYVESLDDDQLRVIKDDYVTRVIEINRIEEELADIMAEFKEKLKPLKEEAKLIMGEIRLGVREKEGKVYTIFDHEQGIASEYSESGKFIKQRPILPTERQTTIKPLVAYGK